VFRDVDALRPGQDFVEAIADRLGTCRACLVLIGRDWLNAADPSGRRRLDQEGDYVRQEIAAALARPDVAVIPVLVEGAAMPAAESLPESIRPLARCHVASRRSLGVRGRSPRQCGATSGRGRGSNRFDLRSSTSWGQPEMGAACRSDACGDPSLPDV
jgi:hypothetical protein